MRLLGIGFLLAFAALAVAANADIRQKKFSNEEIKRMAETRAVIETKFGNIELKFFPDLAPNHVSNFIELSKKGFYNGTIFHRVIPGFMIQGGDPITKDPANLPSYGTGGPGYAIKAEFSKKPHKRGILSMARMNDPDSAGSQFFICFDMDPRQQAMLDEHYTVFGEVIKGMEVADKIASLPRNPYTNNPNDRVEIKIRVIEKR